MAGYLAAERGTIGFSVDYGCLMRLSGLPVGRAILIALSVLAAGCTSTESAVYQKEAFGTTGVFSREYAANAIATCEAARRALLSQGYIVADVKADLVNGQKSFQPAADSHVEVAFHVVCVSDSPEGNKSTVFVNALQDRYAIKKTSSSASVGVGALGAVSLPFGSSDDSLVKVASETIPAGPLYERFFGLTDKYLKQLGADYGTKKPDPLPAVKPATQNPAGEKKREDADASLPAPAKTPGDAAQASPGSPTPSAPSAGAAGAPAAVKPDAGAKPAAGDDNSAPAPELLGPVTTPS